MNMNIDTDTLLNTAKKLAARNPNPKTDSEYCARNALKEYEKYNDFLISMGRHLKEENNTENNSLGTLGEQLEEWLGTAKKLATRNSKSKPLSEYYAKRALEFYSYTKEPFKNAELELDTDTDNYKLLYWKQVSYWKEHFIFHLNCMKTTLELKKDPKKLETTAKELASRNSNPEPGSEYYAKLALKAHRESNKYLITMKSLLKKEKKSLASQNSNPGPDQPTLQTLREKHKEETLKEQEQEIQPQIKRGRSR